VSTRAATAVRYEVEADFIQITSPEGHRYWLKRGDELPDWVTPEQVVEFEASSAVFKYEVI
jgi:hypothetical protein